MTNCFSEHTLHFIFSTTPTPPQPTPLTHPNINYTSLPNVIPPPLNSTAHSMKLALALTSLNLGLLASAFDPSTYVWTENANPSGTVQVSWSLDEPNNSGHFAIKCPTTTGWCGLGFSPNGGMGFSDFAIGYINSSGNPIVSDYNHMVAGNAKPSLDTSPSSLTNTNVEIVGDSTVVTFTKKLISCDGEDMNIQPTGTTRLIWAHSTARPTSPSDLTYHSDRGAHSVMLGKDPAISLIDAPMTLEEITAAEDWDVIDLMLGSANGGTDFVIPAYPAGGYAIEFYEPGTDYTVKKLSQGGIDLNNVPYRIDHDDPNAISEKYDTIVGLGGE